MSRPQSAMPSLAAARCGCGCADVFAVRPGVAPARRGAIDLFTRLDPLVTIGVPDAFWCRPCWLIAHRGPAVAPALA